MHFYGYAMAVCGRYISGHDDVVGVLNDGFLKIFRELESFTARQPSIEASLKAWMRRIFINTAIDHLRKQRHQPQLRDDLEMMPGSQADAEAASAQLSYKHLLGLVAMLSPAYRMVFNLFVIDGFSHEEISQLLSINIGTSKSNLAKAKMNLQKMILSEQKTEHYANQFI